MAFTDGTFMTFADATSFADAEIVFVAFLLVPVSSLRVAFVDRTAFFFIAWGIAEQCCLES